MKTTKPSLASTRCQYRTPAGRQCCTPAGPGSSLCARHAAAQSPESVDFSVPLVDECGNFQRAQHINHSFIRLYRLVAQGRISPRRAAVLAYIGSFILRSLKDIDYDNARFPKKVHAQPDLAPAKQIGPGLNSLPATAAEFDAEVLGTAALAHFDTAQITTAQITNGDHNGGEQQNTGPAPHASAPQKGPGSPHTGSEPVT